MKALSLSFLAALTLSAVPPAAVAESTPPRVLLECDACSDQQRVALAVGAVSTPGEGDIYIVDFDGLNATRYSVVIDGEPGSYSIVADELPIPADMAASLARREQAIAQAKIFTIDQLPDASCRAGGASHAANYVTNQVCRGEIDSRIHGYWATTTASTREGLKELIDRTITGAPPRTRALSMTVKTSDGSVLRVKVTLETDASNGMTMITDIETIEARNGTLSLPLNRDAVPGLYFEGLSARMTADLETMFTRWNIVVRRECSTVHRIRCPVGQPCVNEITCE